MKKKNIETITVWFNDTPMSVEKEIAERHGLKNGDILRSKDKFWEVLKDSCKAGILECQTKKMSEGENPQNG